MRRSSAVWILLLALACHRAVEPFDPDEEAVAPDLSRIFPSGAEQQASRGPALPDLRPGAVADAPRGGSEIRGEVRLASAASAPEGATLFIIARSPGGGPPTAVKRVSDPSFPVRFTLGPGDRMIEGMPFEGPFRLRARLDGDGNATTREDSDLEGEASGLVAVGAEGVSIVIGRAGAGS